MKKNFIIINFVVLTFFLNSFFAQAQSFDGLEINLNVGGCNYNNMCDKGEEDFFSCPEDCTPKNTTGGYAVVYFKNILIDVTYNKATLKWESTIPTRTSVKWGLSQDYKDGMLSNVNFLLEHKVELTGLKPGSLYYFNISADNLLGGTSSIENQVFKTLSLPDNIPPGNPRNVRSQSASSGITILWDNTKDSDFDYVRVMRNTDRFFGSPNIGHLVYEGKGSYFTDINVEKNKEYFYSLFSRDTSGNYSSGSLINVIYESSNIQVVIPPKISETKYTFTLIQGSSTYDFKIGSTLSLSGDETILIKTNYKPSTLNDDLWVEIKENNKVEGKYLFKRLADKDGYITAELPLFREGGYYVVSIYRYSNGVEQILNQGGFNISKVIFKEKNNNVRFIILLIVVIMSILIFIFGLMSLIAAIFRRYLRKKKKRKAELEKIALNIAKQMTLDTEISNDK